MEQRFRPIDLARSAGVSSATVRMYEREGFLPTAERSPSGHRRYRFKHLRALEVARALMRGYGWEYAKRVMRALHSGHPDEVLALVDAKHAEIERGREELDATMSALRLIAETADDERRPIDLAKRSQFARVGEAARQAGVPVSSLHFWEEQGLLKPQRDSENMYRLYSNNDLRQLKLIVMLRQSGYQFGNIRTVLDELGKGNPEAAYAAALQRKHDLRQRSKNCMEATAALWGYLSEWGAFDMSESSFG